MRKQNKELYGMKKLIIPVIYSFRWSSMEKSSAEDKRETIVRSFVDRQEYRITFPPMAKPIS